MSNLSGELRQRNTLLYWFGWYNMLMAVACLLYIFFDRSEILGINRWIKPAKFFLSVGIMVWTMGWIMYYLQAKRTVMVCSVLIFLTMFFENALIVFQAYRHQPSHFNISNSNHAVIFSWMGILIFTFTLTIMYITWLFFSQKRMHISQPYCWGIRLGLLLFIIFSLEGGIMVNLLSHSVHGKDGGAGLPWFNWSTRHGDLRIAHFMGIHALQLVPLAGFYVFKTKKQVQFFALTYFLAAMALLVLALLGIPVISIK